MTFNLVFLKFNNYYNRKIKRFNTLEEYTSNYDYFIDTSVRNINYNDGINISIVLNSRGSNLNSLGYNYILALDAETEEIDSRWFILEEKQTRQGQWVYTLRRDLVADFYDKFMNATVYIEKGWLADGINNNLIFNDENFNANQIKQSETPIKDAIGCKWLIGYVAKPEAIREGSTETYGDWWKNSTIVSDSNSNISADITITTSFDQWDLWKYTQSTWDRISKLTLNFDYKWDTGLTKKGQRVFVDKEGGAINPSDDTKSGQYEIPSSQIQGNIEVGPHLSTNYSYASLSDITKAYNKQYDSIYNAYITATNQISNSTYDQLLTTFSSPKIVYSTVEGVYKKITFKYSSPRTYTSQFTVQYPGNANIYTLCNNVITEAGLTSSSTNSLNYRLFGYIRNRFILGVEDYAVSKFSVKGGNFEHSHAALINEAFDAFAIPLPDSDTLYINENAGSYSIVNGDASWAIAQKMIQTAGSGGFDLQLLPYCPLPFAGSTANEIQITTNQELPGALTWGFDFSWIYPGDSGSGEHEDKSGIVFWLRSNSFETLIPYTDPSNYSDPVEVKCINQLTKCQLASGDYSSIFEFNKAKNYGLTGFTIDCTYKPYAPYIRVAPVFNGLYGVDFNDMRGLVCTSTNYSISRTSDAWDTYERNNLNYQNAFQRGITNLEEQREAQRIQELASIVTGTLGGSVSGAMMGGMMAGGHPAGYIAGGIVGAGTSLAGGIVDYNINEQLYKENKSYTKDMYNYNIQNIQAQPDTLATVGTNVINNKIYPVLIYYECSPVEKEAFKNKIKWNGMSVNVIGQPKNFINNNYFKGQIIYIDLDSAAHEASELANEVAKGLIMEV